MSPEELAPFAELAARVSATTTVGYSEALRALLNIAGYVRPTEAWFGVWECGCTDTEVSPAGIPEFCPVHGEQLVSDRHGRTKVELNHSGVSGYGLRDKHGDPIAVRPGSETQP